MNVMRYLPLVLAFGLAACDRFHDEEVECGGCSDTEGRYAVAALEHGEWPVDLMFSGDLASRAVFSEDDREPMPLDSYPWSAVGRLVTSEGHCTASLIGPDLILTNAHCVLMGDDSNPSIALPQSVRFYPAFHPEQTAMYSAGLRVWLDDLVMERGLVNVSGQLADWAVIRLRQPLGQRYGWLTVGQAVDVGTVSLGGYSGDHRDGEVALVHRDCQMTEQRADGSLIHNCDMTAGASGSPLIRWNGQNAEIIALNAMEAGDRRTGSRYHSGVTFSEHAFNVAVSSEAFARQLGDISPLPAGKKDFYVTYCNDLSQAASVMLGHWEEEQVVTFGPYNLAPRECREIHMGNRSESPFFVTFEARGQRASGEISFCTEPGGALFSDPDADCEAGQQRVSFAQVARPADGLPLVLSALPQQSADLPPAPREEKGKGEARLPLGKDKGGAKGRERQGPNVVR